MSLSTGASGRALAAIAGRLSVSTCTSAASALVMKSM